MDVGRIKAARTQVFRWGARCAEVETVEGANGAVVAGASASLYLALSHTVACLLTLSRDQVFLGSFQGPYDVAVALTFFGLSIAVPLAFAVLIWCRREPVAAWGGLVCAALVMGVNAAAFPSTGTIVSVLVAMAAFQGVRGVSVARSEPATELAPA